ncbi:MAG: ferritin-like domain-containing protein [Clostridia bacterium]|nr:ferritin-like domain-containing protein [Clostridia bacterium]MDD4387593.1 ferritin-like domain-containing protein [Clostridia bacterium]
MYDEFSSDLGYINYPYTGYNRNLYNTKDIYNTNTTVQVSKEVLESIKKSVASEKEDERFYDYLIAISTSKKDKEIIESIRIDERNHNQMFRKIYLELTGIALPKSVESVETELNLTYIQGLEQALMGELSAVEKYRKILAEMTDKQRYNMVFEILTDELKHAAKYNFLITRNLVDMFKK